ncbi:flagellar biosynthesis anti-sigma factor FlgM [Acanthopleuribacter pedis]|uniref:Negative regulator of flagellin synthesis n=1 Tax=Acanthopleuribacter pedis TaxID=442870 RepID=A0A8J7U2B7_9BACT|nr:flagellar biosynthesis anti-sigma factor FlgM [Acanthopleuribacter pedis]MBO1317098.1 flagellar biosynthesis anti-sigma factor FlgM [Acanthopleuribacter pedis]
MKVEKGSVSSSTYASASTAYGKSARTGSRSAVSDSVEVSASATLFQTAQSAIRGVPDVRSAAISGIQQEMAEGTYHRDEREVAQKVIDDELSTDL